MSQQELEDLEQYFVVNINKKQYELVEGGKELQVNLLKFDYFILNR